MFHSSIIILCGGNFIVKQKLRSQKNSTKRLHTIHARKIKKLGAKSYFLFEKKLYKINLPDKYFYLSM
jgi:hypothetical protein